METNLTAVDTEFDIFSCLQYEQDNNCKDNPVKFNAIGLAMLASRNVDRLQTGLPDYSPYGHLGGGAG